MIFSIQKNLLKYKLLFTLLVLLQILSFSLSAQYKNVGTINGVVYSAVTGKPIAGVKIYIANNNTAIIMSNDSLNKTFDISAVKDTAVAAKNSIAAVDKNSGYMGTASFADGYYHLKLFPNVYTVCVAAAGFQTKQIQNTEIINGKITVLNIMLFPVVKDSNTIKKEFLSYSLNNQDTVLLTSAMDENSKFNYKLLFNKHAYADDVISKNQVQPGTAKDGALLLRQLSGVTVFDVYNNPLLQSIHINGLGDRYNQVLLNGLPFNSFSNSSKAYSLSSFPVEAIETVSIKTFADASTFADFSGGTVRIATKDMPDKSFIYVQGGGSFFDATKGKKFYTDQKSNTQWLGLAGKATQLPGNFPTLRNRVFLNEYNVQEQVGFAKQLNNNVAPTSNTREMPGNKIVIGAGKILNLKNGKKLGIIGYLQQQKNERIDNTEVQAMPNVAANTYPFVATVPLIKAYAVDTTYCYMAQTVAVVNASYVYNKSKIALYNFLGTQLNSDFTKRTQLLKPDEDTLGRHGINYKTEQRSFLNTQLTGEHVLSNNQGLRLEWQVGYSFYKQQNPDERNVLLVNSPVKYNEFKVATQSAASLKVQEINFTNSGRRWRHLKRHDFNAAFNLSSTFNFFGFAQQFSGGMQMQSNYIESNSDLFLINQQDSGYYLLNQLFDANHYAPEKLAVTNFYTRTDVSANISTTINNRGNYTASRNIGAAYLQFNNRFTNYLRLLWGVKAESSNQLISNSQYQFTETFKYPQQYTLNLNDKVERFNVLPHAMLIYSPVQQLQAYAAFSKTVNRPQLEELANYSVYQPLSFLVQQGNTVLENATIENYAAGINWTHLDNDNTGNTKIDISGFYKMIDRPIENYITGYSTGNVANKPRNSPTAYISGVQASVKLNAYSIAKVPFLSYLTLLANGNITNAIVKAGVVKGDGASFSVVEHSLSGTPAYTYNGGLQLQHPKWPNVSILYQQTGDYVQAVGTGAVIKLPNGNTITTMPYYRVAERNQLDIQIAQSFLKASIQIIVGVNNVLQSPFVLYQDLNGDKKFDNPLQLAIKNNTAYYKSGTDNTILHMKTQKQFYCSISYLFK